MSRNTLDTESIVQLLMADAVATLGEDVRSDVLATAGNAADNAYRRMQPTEATHDWPAREGESVEEAQRAYDLEVVEQFQEVVQEVYWNTTWPACPRHPNHPLWYSEDQHAWCCPRDGAALASLGALAALYARAT
jgi:hypothetical protein